MRLLSLLTLCLLVAPQAANAQVEIGIDAGVQLETQSGLDNRTQLSIPTGSGRIGFPGERVSFETLASLNVISRNGTVTLLGLTPGVNFAVGEGGGYVRAEGAMLLVSGGGDTDTEFGAGAAAGLKKPINGGPVSFRLEVGYDRFFDAEVNQFRLLFGLSAALGG